MINWDSILNSIYDTRDEYAIQEAQRDYEIELTRHIIDGTGHDLFLRKGDDILHRILDAMIVEVRPYIYLYKRENSLKFLVSHNISEQMNIQFQASFRYEKMYQLDMSDCFSAYRGIKIIPVDYLDDEIILLSPDAFSKSWEYSKYPMIPMEYDNGAFVNKLPPIVDGKLIAVSRDMNVLLSELSDKELRLLIMERGGKYSYSMIVEEIDRRGLR